MAHSSLHSRRWVPRSTLRDTILLKSDAYHRSHASQIRQAATDVRQTRVTDAAHNSPAHEAGASRGGTWSTDHELSTHASLQTHEIDLTQSGNSHEKCAIRARVSSTGNICWLGPLLR